MKFDLNLAILKIDLTAVKNYIDIISCCGLNDRSEFCEKVVFLL